MDTVTVDWDAETAPAFTVTVAVWLMPMLLAVAETTFPSGTGELRVQVATPLPLAVCVRPDGTRLFEEPDTEIVTLALGTPFPN